MRSHLAVFRRRVVGVDERHVAVGAFLRGRRIVERSRALSRDAGRLPVVVLVEAANPAIAVDRDVEVHLVARRTEFSGLLAMEWLQEGVAVRRRIEIQQAIVQPAQRRALARRQIVQRRVLDDEIALAHRAPHVNDGVARRAREPRLRFGRRNLLPDRPVEPSVEEHGVVVAPGAPFRGARADDVLHVLDRFAVPLIVERREVVHRRFPLVVDVGVAAPAGRARREEVGGDDAAAGRVGGRGKERSVGTGAFARHRDRRRRRVLNSKLLLPLPLGNVRAAERRGDERASCQRIEHRAASDARTFGSPGCGEQREQQKRGAADAEDDMRPHEPPMGRRRSTNHDDQAGCRGDDQHRAGDRRHR